MIITRLELEHFGKFKNKEIKLEEGINLIYGENEAGKSTIHTFIKGILFGIDPLRGRASKSKKDTYNRYLPWDYPAAYGGSMDIVIDEKKYRLKRSVLSNDKSFELIDMHRGRQVELDNGLIEDLIPGLTESVYNNTISFGQLKSQTDTQLASQLNNHIANLSLTKSKEVNVEKALEALGKEKRSLTKLVEDNTSHIHKLQEEIQLGQNQLKELEELSEKWEESNSRLRGLEDKREKITQSNYIKKMKDLPLILEKYSSYKSLLRQSSQVEELINGTLDSSRKIPDYEIRLKELNADKLQASRRHNISMGISTLIFVAVLLVVFLLTKARPVSLALLIISVFIYPMNFLYRNKQEKTIRNQQDYQIEELKKYIYSFRSKQEKSVELKERLEEIDNQRDPLHDTIMTYIQAFITEDQLTQEAIQRLIEDIQGREVKIEGDLRTLEKLYQEEKFKLEEINWAIKELDNVEEDLLKNQEDYKTSKLKAHETKRELEAVTIAMETISELSIEIHDSFGRELDGAVSKIVHKVTRGKYKDLIVDENLEIRIDIGKEYVSMDKLSEGTIKQVYFALRLAVGGLLINEKMPILLDDSFALYDDMRIKAALKELVNQEQVMIFTCHSREEKVLKELDLPYNLIKL